MTADRIEISTVTMTNSSLSPTTPQITNRGSPSAYLNFIMHSYMQMPVDSCTTSQPVVVSGLPIRYLRYLHPPAYSLPSLPASQPPWPKRAPGPDPKKNPKHKHKHEQPPNCLQYGIWNEHHHNQRPGAEAFHDQKYLLLSIFRFPFSVLYEGRDEMV